jgi:hypothetical protein
MDTTKEKIANLAKNKPGISANEIIIELKMNASGIFRHLKTMVQNKQLSKIGKPPKVLYYYPNNMNEDNTQKAATDWALTGDPQAISPDWLCPTRDVFQARQERLLQTLRGTLPENSLYLLVGAVGEIGNNSFDHNIGSWRDTAGVIFFLDEKNREIILADRGQGLLATIKRVEPQTTTHLSAMNTAFTKVISGRYPEKRGNGLKYVKNVIESCNLRLKFYSGDAESRVTSAGLSIKPSNINIPGTFAVINY